MDFFRHRRNPRLSLETPIRCNPRSYISCQYHNAPANPKVKGRLPPSSQSAVLSLHRVAHTLRYEVVHKLSIPLGKARSGMGFAVVVVAAAAAAAAAPRSPRCGNTNPYCSEQPPKPLPMLCPSTPPPTGAEGPVVAPPGVSRTERRSPVADAVGTTEFGYFLFFYNRTVQLVLVALAGCGLRSEIVKDCRVRASPKTIH